MKKITAFILAAVLVAGAFTGCKKEREESGLIVPYSSQVVGEIQIEAAMNEEKSGNETAFTLNSVVDSGVREEVDGKTVKYIYVNATIKNTSDTDYSLSYLNNFELILPDGTSIVPHLRTDNYGREHYASYALTPFTVPAGGEFTGYICGFEVDESINEFTVCFYPTQNDNNKQTVIKVKVSADDIKQLAEDK